MKFVTTPSGSKITQEDNERIVKFKKSVVQLTERFDAVKAHQLQSSKARTELKSAKAMLKAANDFLEAALAAEYRLATYKARKASRAA